MAKLIKHFMRRLYKHRVHYSWGHSQGHAKARCWYLNLLGRCTDITEYIPSKGKF